jgi:hypothetical protein
MIREPIHLKRAVLSMAIGCLLAASPVLAAPGDPFGDDDTGCTPSTALGRKCGKAVLKALAKLRVSVVKCHLTQAGHAFQNGSGTNGFSNAEENCEIGPSNTSAKAKFDATIASLADIGCDATILASANAKRDVLLGDSSVVGSLDNLNGTFFCDTTSGNPIDPDGEDAGTIPATPENYKCEVTYAKAWAKLTKYLYQCHAKMAASSFKGVVFDEEMCENTGGKSGLDKYNLLIGKAVLAGFCPPCVTDAGPTNATDLGVNTVADADANLQDVYICPGP